MSLDPTDPPLPGVRVSAPKCVRCGQPVTPRTRPFCSQRCADLDLGAWLTERYRVETAEAPQDPQAGEDDASPDQAASLADGLGGLHFQAKKRGRPDGCPGPRRTGQPPRSLL